MDRAVGIGKKRKKEGKKGGKRERIKRREKEKKRIIGEKEREGRKLGF